MHASKITKIMDHALKMGIPVIGINDSGERASRKASIPLPVTVKFSIETPWLPALFLKFL